MKNWIDNRLRFLDYYMPGNVITGLDIAGAELNFKVFPNPASSVIRIQSSVLSLQSSILEIYDLHGRKLIEKLISPGLEGIDIDVSRLENGIYFCQLLSKQYSGIQKLIIQK